MARKGERKAEKRLAAGKAAALLRKEKTWAIKPTAGPHNRKSAVPLGFVVRDLLGMANTLREVKYILNKGLVSVDGRTVKDSRFPVGLFDLLEAKPEKGLYRMLVNRKGQLIAREEKQGKKEKLCKIVSKTAFGKDRQQLQTNDGRTFSEEKPAAKVGDSLLISLPGQRILQHFKFVPGSTALVVSGRNVGTLATIKKIIPGTMRRPKLVTLDADGKEFQTTAANIFIVGDKKPAIAVKSG